MSDIEEKLQAIKDAGPMASFCLTWANEWAHFVGELDSLYKSLRDLEAQVDDLKRKAETLSATALAGAHSFVLARTLTPKPDAQESSTHEAKQEGEEL